MRSVMFCVTSSTRSAGVLLSNDEINSLVRMN